MKKCGGCKEVKPFEEFHKSSRMKDGRQNYCKECNKKAVVKHIHTHEGHNYQVRKDRRLGLQEQMQDLKRKTGCFFCKEDEPVVLEYHHLEPGTKRMDPSNAIKRSWQFFLDEIAKCVLLCANCHRKVHLGKLQLPGVDQPD